MNYATTLAIRLVCLLGFSLTYQVASAQCIPDSLVAGTPGLYPDSLAAIPGCQYSETDITFVLPRDTTVQVFGQTLTLPFNFFRIESIQGLPPGMSWSCNLSPGCLYDLAPGNPLPDSVGCIRVFGTPAIPGNYTLIVNVTANLDILGSPSDQPTTFVRELKVGACSFGTDCFTYTVDEICAPATVTLKNELDSVLNGNCDVDWSLVSSNGFSYQTKDLQPLPVVLLEAGEYVLNFSALVDTFPWQMDSIVIQTVNCSDLLDGPDLYWKLFDPFATELINTTATPINNAVVPITINTGGFALKNGPYEFQVWDEDAFGGDDGCAGSAGASLIFPSPPSQAGANTLILNGLTVTFWVSKPTLTVACSDTFQLAAPPAIPEIEVDTNRICFGDSLVLRVSSVDSVNWYQDFVAILGAHDTMLVVKTGGFYQVEVIDRATSCGEISSMTLIEVVEVAVPSFIYDGSGNFKISAPSPAVDYLWFNDEGIQMGMGTAFSPSNSGIFYVVAKDKVTGCESNATLSFSAILSDLAEAWTQGELSLFPNPVQDELTVALDLHRAQPISWKLTDLYGRTLQAGAAPTTLHWDATLSFSELTPGLYFLYLLIPDGQVVRQVLKS